MARHTAYIRSVPKAAAVWWQAYTSRMVTSVYWRRHDKQYRDECSIYLQSDYPHGDKWSRQALSWPVPSTYTICMVMKNVHCMVTSIYSSVHLTSCLVTNVYTYVHTTINCMNYVYNLAICMVTNVHILNTHYRDWFLVNVQSDNLCGDKFTQIFTWQAVLWQMINTCTIWQAAWWQVYILTYTQQSIAWAMYTIWQSAWWQVYLYLLHIAKFLLHILHCSITTIQQSVWGQVQTYTYMTSIAITNDQYTCLQAAWLQVFTGVQGTMIIWLVTSEHSCCIVMCRTPCTSCVYLFTYIPTPDNVKYTPDKLWTLKGVQV